MGSRTCKAVVTVGGRVVAGGRSVLTYGRESDNPLSVSVCVCVCVCVWGCARLRVVFDVCVCVWIQYMFACVVCVGNLVGPSMEPPS